ncbi:mitochondrial protein Pet127-domain-containing protein [Mariannaea sp. PMI_226]|nr:mitochondrial protein Pet127-domain-containing protein [Mariannaea sp. PMI_226]
MQEKLQHAPSSVSEHGQEYLGESLPRPQPEEPEEPSAKKSSKSKAEAKPGPSPKKSTKAGAASTSKQKQDPWKNRKLNVQKVMPKNLTMKPIEEDETLDVPKLAHSLDRVLFNPGVYELQDRRSRVFNFDPYLASIMPVKEFDFDALTAYITSSKDHKLRALCAKHNKKYCGSTSSMTAILSHFHFLISAWRKPNFRNLSRDFNVDLDRFTRITRAPAAAFATLKDGVYAIDADKQFDTANVLSLLGKSMEKLLTLPKEDFEKYRRTRSHQLSEEERNAEEGYHFTTLGDFMMRSQLDAHDPRLPGSGMFDLKTRAVLPIRMDVGGYEKGVGYELRVRQGQWESYEREYYDMIRSAFLKYSLQVRMGRMDGIFVAYHNTMRIFGFQYISLEEMDVALHGTSSRWVGDSEFKASLHLLNKLLNKAAERFPGRSLRLHVETRETNPPLTYFFAEPVDEEFITEMQESGKESVEKLQREILGLARAESEAEVSRVEEEIAELEQEEEEEISLEKSSQDEDGQNVWNDMMAKVDEAVEGDSRGLQAVRDAIQEALEQSGLLRAQSDAERESYLNALVEAVTVELPTDKESSEASGELYNAEQDDAEKVSGGTNAVAEPSLKDLIIKVAQNVETKSTNLKVFERVLSQLVAESKQAEAEPEREAPGSDEGATAKEADEEISKEIPGVAKENDKASAKAKTQDTKSGKKRELLGLYVTIQNKLGGKTVPRVMDRPGKGSKVEPWRIEYLFTELEQKKAETIYAQMQKRRKTALQNGTAETRSKAWYKMWGGQMAKRVTAGRTWRGQKNKEEADKPIRVAWAEEPLPADARYYVEDDAPSKQ